MITEYHYSAAFGTLFLYFEGQTLVYLGFNRHTSIDWVRRHFHGIPIEPGLTLPEAYEKQLTDYLRGKPIKWEIPYKLIGTPFQKSVWHELLKIPYGTVVTYKQVGENVGTKGFRGVGQAVGANPISIIVPCHRVVGVSGLVGFGGGIAIKQWLLRLENVLLPWDGFA